MNSTAPYGWRRLAQAIGDLVCPTSCGGCGTVSQHVLCGTCSRHWWEHRYRGQDRAGSPASAVPTWSFAPYRGPWRRVLGKYKDGDRRDVIPLLALTLAVAVEETYGGHTSATPLILVPVPSTPARTRHRGDWPWGDVCRAAAELLRQESGLNCQVRAALRAVHGRGDQDHLSRDDRWRNRRGGFVAHRPSTARSLCMVLDDVTTTGATVTAAVDALHDAGWLVTDCVTVARVRSSG